MKKLSIFLLALITLTSCLDEFLDVQPVSETYSAKYWKTESEAKAALASVYADMQTNFKPNFALNYIGWYELRSDNFFGNPVAGTYPFSYINMNVISPSHPSSDWNGWYKSIATTNYALHFIPGMTTLTEAKRNHLIAEASFLRAYCYFNLIRIWGNVPLIDKPTFTFDDVVKPFRDSSKVVMDSLILKDLDVALSKVDVSQNDIFIFSAGALYALCTDVAMWNHDYAKAVTYSQKLFDLNRYKLVSGTDFNKVCSSAITEENILTLKWSYLNNGYNPIAQTLTTQYVLVSKKVKDKWAETEWLKDVRRRQTIDSSVVYASNYLSAINPAAAMWKYEPVKRLVSNVNEKFIPLYRLADIILLRAEALNKLADAHVGSYTHQDALDELNKVRNRAGLDSMKLTNQYIINASSLTYGIESAILQERQFELLGEGKRWFDLMRTGRAITTMNDYFETELNAHGVTNYTKFTAEWQLYWPVFQDNIIENSNLAQTGLY